MSFARKKNGFTNKKHAREEIGITAKQRRKVRVFHLSKRKPTTLNV